ncbi:hypothetical protein [Brevibacterium aurantiacum]|uniref:hypothetical protein n=1 Tax=Brevibacterium aurantiacum TaxID=273384 RepID=UPI0011C02918|nr:hypothetical protein [Brevibacterium aurantiacum]
MTSDSGPAAAAPASRPKPHSPEFSAEATNLYEETIEEFKIRFEYESRLNAGQDERILVRHVESARDSVLSSRIGKAIDIAIVWLLPIGFCLWGISGGGLVKAFNGEPVDPGTFIIFVVGALFLGTAAGLYIRSASIQQWLRKIKNKKNMRGPVKVRQAPTPPEF